MDWIALFEAHSIDYVTKGKNTKRGEVSIQCPWCGDDDPSHHMGINLTKEAWGCHRNVIHRGKAPIKLLAALLGCSASQAKLVLAQFNAPDPDTLASALAALTGLSEAPRAAEGPFDAPAAWQGHEFRPIHEKGATGRFWRYLEGRGFDDIDWLCQLYKLKCCLTGRFKDRIIIPFYRGGTLIGWTGRAIAPTVNAPRYLSSGAEVKTTVFIEDALYKGDDLLFVVEGPLDALKLDWYGQQVGARATCVFGVSMTVDQIVILNTLRKRFRRVVLLFDQDALEPSLHAGDWLFGENIIVGRLEGAKDPGELSKQQVLELVKHYVI